MNSAGSKKRYWQLRELIVIGTFAALIKISTILIAISGGGMNPVTMVIKNIVATSLLIVLLYKVRKFGVITHDLELIQEACKYQIRLPRQARLL